MALTSPPWFDLPMACLGAVISGSFVAWINFEHGAVPAATATLKQAGYAFVATGLVLQFCRWLSQRTLTRPLAAALAVGLPLLVTASLLYGVHSLRGTPEPLLSTLPGTVLSLLGLVLVTRQSLWGEADQGRSKDLSRKQSR